MPDSELLLEKYENKSYRSAKALFIAWIERGFTNDHKYVQNAWKYAMQTCFKRKQTSEANLYKTDLDPIWRST